MNRFVALAPLARRADMSSDDGQSTASTALSSLVSGKVNFAGPGHSRLLSLPRELRSVRVALTPA